MTDNPRQMTPGPGGTYVLCAGGTGGHMVPAHCLALELMARGHKVHLVTDERGLRFPGLFPGVPVTKVEAASTGRSGWRSLPQVALSIWKGRSAARKLFKDIHPRAVIGFGGYPALPGLLAGLSLYLPCLIHEQNAVLGRTNRYLAPRVRAIATSFPRVRRMEGSWQRRAHFVGNPVRPEVLAARDVKFDENAARLKLLVTGGSQGAAVLNRVVPAAVRLLPAAVRANLDITHQGRDEDREEMLAAYHDAGIEPTIAAYFPDLPAEMASSHIVIARSGASTVAELAVMGRPSILVPLPIATDDHQADNAAALVAVGGAQMIRQQDFTPEQLAEALTGWLTDRKGLAEAAAAARAAGHPEAAIRLANLVIATGLIA
ncbi:undecaprenyldiphospho-muramoylpentapeptide beta-N-acetylglucosaminyltransferase [Sandarakinorhabdus limnophila]|uniref:undecaprenyldiphospho-muramoylpentapeptide beta-N-acetylglucosaminyltransferase n=1 Tax=Sandarakinorhabdus limnophila TaxID=210512 RepID=UPI0003B45A82|nr:undecaprenyldiphospho-muramoylpentapeptide beta-N-acetylglucosaminyltransferase [Sandarakinorhabdus limnophila]